MYNVGFGDCFCIRDRKSSLLVDFGAANSKIEGRPRREVFDVIISDLTTIRKKKSASDTFSYGSSVRASLYDEEKKIFLLTLGKFIFPMFFQKKK